ncbi:hypothetical protein [Fulvivirga kasyanovii]|uniref:Uncharacterized protein n=1 Tax=Fulvivirga kasyanovii TaxID=396812 RepID=A0ABW9RJ07_9BACT|nr:hypothetical protein [Fulvivirga kasyanovii]MTI23911.1 hypothetical protein [Fulvivirga kasyanovii]
MSKTPPAFIFKYLPVVEKLLLLLLIIGLTINYFSGGLYSLIMISLMGLSCVAFLNAYQPSKVPPPEEGKSYGFKELLAYQIMPKMIWIGTSVLLIGILFYILRLEGFLNMVFIGSIAVTIGAFLLLVLKLTGTKQMEHVMPVLYRSTPVLIIGIYIFMQSRPM